MAAPKRATHVVSHKRLYLMVDGKLQHVEQGSQLTLDKADKLGDKVKSLKAAEVVDLTKEKEEK